MNYTVDSVTALKTYLTQAKKILKESNKQTEIDNAVTELDKKVTELVKISALKDAIAAADALKADEYTQESWEAFQATLTTIKAVATKSNATQVEVDQAKVDLETAQKALVKVTKVATESELKAAVENVEVKNILLTADITLTDQLVINRELVLRGTDETANKVITGKVAGKAAVLIQENGNKAKLKDLTIVGPNTTAGGWDVGEYAIQVYKAKEVVLENVTVKNTNAGILVNSATVTVNNIVTEENEFGGIEVSKGEGVDTNPKLTIQGKSNHGDAEGKPAIWLDGTKLNDNWVLGEPADNLGQYNQTIPKDESGKEKDQLWFMFKQQ